MANHKSAIKRIRANRAKQLRNRFQLKTARAAAKKLKNLETKAEAADYLKKVISLFDKLAKKNIIHKNKAANKKSKLAKMVNRLAA